MIVKKRIGLRFGLYLICALCWQTVQENILLAGLEDLPIGARSLAMGTAYVGVANTADAVFLNPAGLVIMSGIEATLFYQKPFGLDDVTFGSVALSVPLWKYRIGIGLSHLGHEFYREQQFAFGFAHHFQKKIYFGVNASYQTLSIDGYGTSGVFGLDVGLLVPLNPKLTWGLQTKNINRGSIGASGETRPQSLKTGFSLKVHPRLLLALDIFKDIRFAEELRFGTEFRPIAGLAVRAGMANNPDRFSAGFGIEKHLFKVDYAFFTHNDLGLTHQLSFSILFNQKSPPKQQPELSAHPPDPASPAQEITPSKVDLNLASAEALQTLPGIGPALAQAIILYRKESGEFRSVEDLKKVPGIGAKTFEKVKDRIIVQRENQP